jgi:hypothetical protein
MKAKLHILQASYPPEAVKAMGQALEDAWKEIKGSSTRDEETAVEAARLRLATFILASVSGCGNDTERLKSFAALAMYARDPQGV